LKLYVIGFQNQLNFHFCRDWSYGSIRDFGKAYFYSMGDNIITFTIYIIKHGEMKGLWKYL
jgi:hypothetical protein